MMNFNEKIVFRKFLLDNTYFFLLCSLSLSLIVWVIQAVNFLDFISEDGHSFDIYFYFTILNFPKIFKNILPFIFFMSLFYTISKYEDNNELKIFWINGINKINAPHPLSSGRLGRARSLRKSGLACEDRPEAHVQTSGF